MAHVDLLRRRFRLAHPALRLYHLLFRLPQSGLGGYFRRTGLRQTRPGGYGSLAGRLLRRRGGFGQRFGAVQLLLRDLVFRVHGPVADAVLGGADGFRLRGRLLRFGLSHGRFGRANRGGVLRYPRLQDLHLFGSRAGRGAGLRQNRPGYGRSKLQVRLRAIRLGDRIFQAGPRFRRPRLVIAGVDLRD